MENMYLTRSAIRKLPGKIMKTIPVPNPEIVEGAGCRKDIGQKCLEAGFSRVLVLTDHVIKDLGYCDAIEESLRAAGISYCIYDGIASEPHLEYIDAGRSMALENDVQCIISLGGGSVMDTGKMIAAASRLKDVPTKLLPVKFLFVPGGTLPIFAIPSTAGTGAEMTVGAVISKRPGVKSATVIVGLDVRAVFLDSSLMTNAPWSITAACGIDALSHGLEGCMADVAADENDVEKSRRCVKLVFDNLMRLKDRPDDDNARLAMCRAANLGGNAINKQLAGDIHSFAHSIGARYRLPHGVAIALCMMPVMRHQADKCRDKLEMLARYCSFEDAGMFLDALESLIRQCGLSPDGSVVLAKDYGKLSVSIAKDSVNYSAPQTLSRREIISILTEISMIKW